MPVLVLVIVVLLIVFGPGLWVKSVMTRYRQPDDRYGGTGAELARHLLESYGIKDVKVEQTDQGDHFDPAARAVRLSADNYASRSLTAITVAAHEVGHAVQHDCGYRPLQWRTHLVRLVEPGQKLAVILLIASPFISIVSRVPVTGLVTFVAGFLVLGMGALVHLLTLPAEIDASFVRALPMLRQQKILHEGDERHARRLLMAAAATYLAASLMSLLNVARWLVLLRR